MLKQWETHIKWGFALHLNDFSIPVEDVIVGPVIMFTHASPSREKWSLYANKQG